MNNIEELSDRCFESEEGKSYIKLIFEYKVIVKIRMQV
jgi:hypothetical protein